MNRNLVLSFWCPHCKKQHEFFSDQPDLNFVNLQSAFICKVNLKNAKKTKRVKLKISVIKE